jgi:hypothetical protein
MKFWLIAILAYLVVAVVSYVAILVFLRPQPLISEHMHDDLPHETHSDRKLRRWDAVALIGFPVTLVLSPMILLFSLLWRVRKKE